MTTRTSPVPDEGPHDEPTVTVPASVFAGLMRAAELLEQDPAHAPLGALWDSEASAALKYARAAVSPSSGQLRREAGIV